ncbi:hypothetical protein P378_02630 [Desulforamulus profundi]|uniref:Uncharacterized protein n=1 Tax=Desulforamulus profundi TaxID=1383067 RepID=A0A2C6MIE9_9FIRM|nr:DUF523 domain-containing protein [Desulforamulus profundi]PHJ39592.1 hypothetical protein P378_02630 [Desulforamulus profundi]
MILVSACLAGIPCKYHGGDNLIQPVAELIAKGLAIPVCPEVLGGLATPREPVDIEQGDGFDALAGRARLLNESGQEVTAEFLAGAARVLQIARRHDVKAAILKERSPSCGSSWIYNRLPGTTAVRRKLVDGMGVTAALLTKNNIQVFSEEQVTEELLNKLNRKI